MKREVMVIFEESVNFIIDDIEDDIDAEDQARGRWLNGDRGVHLGNEWCTITRVIVKPLPPSTGNNCSCMRCGKPFPREDLLAGNGDFLGWCVDCDMSTDPEVQAKLKL
jgi:hypothetical protein